MARIIAVVNQKGGVGKTTTSLSVAAYLAKMGKFCLLIDLDPQANATSGLGVDYNSVQKSTYDALTGKETLSSAIVSTGRDGLHLVPANAHLAGASVEMTSLERREFRLAEALKEIDQNYDFVFIDCPPSLGLLTVNGLVAANEVLMPVQAEYYALEGLGQLLQTINLVKKHLKPDLKVLGAVLTMYDKRNNLSEEVLAQMQTHFPHTFFSTVIPRNVRLAEAPSHGKLIMEYDGFSRGARAYEKLAKEIMASSV